MPGTAVLVLIRRMSLIQIAERRHGLIQHHRFGDCLTSFNKAAKLEIYLFEELITMTIHS